MHRVGGRRSGRSSSATEFPTTRFASDRVVSFLGRIMTTQTQNDPQPQSATTPASTVALPDEVRNRFNGELAQQQIVAWAEFDLDASNRYAQQYAILTEDRLLILGAGPLRTLLLTD